MFQMKSVKMIAKCFFVNNVFRLVKNNNYRNAGLPFPIAFISLYIVLYSQEAKFHRNMFKDASQQVFLVNCENVKKITV